jgi:hypothetical protein
MSVLVTKLTHELALINHNFKRKWTDVAADGKSIQNNSEQSIRNIPTIVTIQMYSTKNESKTTNKQMTFRSIPDSTLHPRRAFGTQYEKHKIIFFGDSHASDLIKNLNESYKVTGFVKPNAGAMVLSDTAKEEIEKLTKEDIVIFWGGSNYIARSASRSGLTYIMKFLMANQHTNIILINAPCRFDLHDSACVNEEVRAFNRKLNNK